MTKHQKTIFRVCSSQTPSDIRWDELQAALESVGYVVLKTGRTGGSRRKFYNKDKDDLIILHEPHPSKIVDKGAVKDVAEHLKAHGFSGETL